MVGQKYTIRTIAVIMQVIILINFFSINVLALGGMNSATTSQLQIDVIGSEADGDCIIATYGDVEILIDTTKGDDGINQVSQIVNDDKDKTWEYVIFTHPDDDHIGKAKDLFEVFDSDDWKVENVIDFGYETYSNPNNKSKFNEYKQTLKSLKYSFNYFSATDELNDNEKIKRFEVDSRLVISVLYNSCASSYKSDNNLSVCVLIEFDDQKMLFTGDLEKSGEDELLVNHRELLKNVTFFKASHHGSYYSNTEDFIDWIRPAYVAITKGQSNVWNPKDGKAELPSIARFLKYTDYIYPTYVIDCYETSEFKCLFGTISFIFDGKDVEVISELNNGCNIRTAVLDYRIWYDYLIESFDTTYDVIDTYVFDENSIRLSDGQYDVNPDYVVSYCDFNCTLVKYGHYDILIDCGSMSYNSTALVEKLKDYVVDGTIEYVIVSHFQLPNISQLVSNKNASDSVFDSFKVENLIDGKNTNAVPFSGSKYATYLSLVKDFDCRTSVDKNEILDINVCNVVELSVYGSCNDAKNDENENSLIVEVDFRNHKMMFVGDQINFTNFVNEHKNRLEKVDLLRFSNAYTIYSSMPGLDDFLSCISPQTVFLGSPTRHKNSNGQMFFSVETERRFNTYIKNITSNPFVGVYACGYIDYYNSYWPVNGDLEYSIKYSGNSKQYLLGVFTVKGVPPKTIDRMY